MMKLVLFVFVILVSNKQLSAVSEQCPTSVNCITTQMTQQDCPAGSRLRPKNLSHNCCSYCDDKLSEQGDSCISSTDCQPGLKCVIQTCQLDPTQVCSWAERMHPSVSWTRNCQPDGMYAAKQCKGEKATGTCFCYDADGKRIFGEWPWSDAENMTCACSRYVAELKKTRSDVMIHCNSKGNFENLQCDDGLCWCSDEKTGKPYSKIVPEKMMNLLPCYSSSSAGAQYLRKCDSVIIQHERIKKLLKEKGTTITSVFLSCNPDGSYGRVQVESGWSTCTYKDETAMDEYKVDITTPASQGMNCNCAYDKYVAGLDGKNFNLKCATNGNGNYNVEQLTGSGLKYCVDSDGFRFVDPQTKPDCSKWPTT